MTYSRSLAAAGAGLVGLLMAAPSSAQVITIDFDGVSAPGAFSQIPPGFGNGPLLEFPDATLDGGVILLDVLFAHSATSGPNIYASCDTCMLGDGSGLPGKITGVFAACVDSIELDVINGFGGSSGVFTLTAFDALGAIVAADSAIAAPMGSAGFVQHLAVVGTHIAAFEVTTGLAPGYTFAIDTVVFNVPEIGASYCTATPNSTGQPATIAARGCSSVAANKLTLFATPLPQGQFGLFFYGDTAIRVPFGNGFRCVGSPAYRLDVTSTGNAGALETTLDITNPPEPAAQILPGSTWNFQAWYRDPAAGGASFDLSDGLAVTFRP